MLLNLLIFITQLILSKSIPNKLFIQIEIIYHDIFNATINSFLKM